MRVTTLVILTLVLCLPHCALASTSNLNVTYNINTSTNRTPISKYIYGSNWGADSNYTINRNGGNRLTAYNWENNWSNAGADWLYENDQYFGTDTTPGKMITDFHDQSLLHNQDSIITLQMAGYVSAPVSGQHLNNSPAPSSYFYPVQFAKGTPFCSPPDNPDNNDGVVYMDEFVNFLVSKYGHAGDPNGVKFYSLDNEPDCWQSTHSEVHPAKPTCLEIKNKGVALSTAVKNVDPNAQILGLVSYGFAGYLDFGGASDWSSVRGNSPWFISYYLDEMRIASNSAGRRLLDVLDIHWYPEAQDGAGNRITNPVPTAAMYNARMQAPRTLWDASYLYPGGEISWINQWYFTQYLPLIPKIKSSIDTYYPDTNLSITEYAYGGENHWSGGIATADVLGIFGKYGIYIATYWGSGSYVDAAVKIYRNYDGNNSTFGNTEVYSSMSNKTDSSIYASITDSDACEVHLIVINKNITKAITGTFNITSPQNFVSGRVWHFDNSGSAITETTPIGDIANNKFTYTIPPTTVCHIVLQIGTSLSVAKCKIAAGKTQYLNNSDYNDMKDTFEASGFIVLPKDCNDITSVEVNIVSAADGNLIHNETLNDFNPALVNSKGKYTHTAKTYKGQAGKITSLTLDFRKKTFALKAKNIDLTGLACPVKLEFTMNGYDPNGLAEETIVNGKTKSIPTRLMRLYKDTLIVTKSKVRDVAKASSDSLSVKGDIAVADMNLDTGEPNLVTKDVIITLSDANDANNTQTFTIPPGSFKASKKGHLYKCSKINPAITPVANVNTLVTASIDLDKCAFTVSITKADLNVTSNDMTFGLSFADFNETADLW